MDKGIRAASRELFVSKNELRRRGEAYTGPKGNTEFRKDVMSTLMQQFGITLASASTHYNDAFKFIKGLNAELVSGLGRAEDKKGGRKKVKQVLPVNTVLPIEETVSILSESMLLEDGAQRLVLDDDADDADEVTEPADVALEVMV